MIIAQIWYSVGVTLFPIAGAFLLGALVFGGLCFMAGRSSRR